MVCIVVLTVGGKRRLRFGKIVSGHVRGGCRCGCRRRGSSTAWRGECARGADPTRVCALNPQRRMSMVQEKSGLIVWRGSGRRASGIDSASHAAPRSSPHTSSQVTSVSGERDTQLQCAEPLGLSSFAQQRLLPPLHLYGAAFPLIRSFNTSDQQIKAAYTSTRLASLLSPAHSRDKHSWQHGRQPAGHDRPFQRHYWRQPKRGMYQVLSHDTIHTNGLRRLKLLSTRPTGTSSKP